MQLNQIRELKARSEDGRCLESTQVQKIQREPAIRAALRRLEEGYVFLMEEPTAEKEPSAEKAHTSQAGKGQKRSRAAAGLAPNPSQASQRPRRTAAHSS